MSEQGEYAGLSAEKAALAVRHNQAAPWWAVALILSCSIGLSTSWIQFANYPGLQSFWSGYVLDSTGPAWTYILIRGLYREWADNSWSRFFTAERALVLCLGAVYAIEFLQYIEWYEATYDPKDLLAYASLIVPLYLVDRKMNASAKQYAS